MRSHFRSSLTMLAPVLAAASLLTTSPAHAQVSGGVDVNTSRKTGDQSECAIAKNPTNKYQLFVLCNNTGPGLFAARSIDLGKTWIFPDPTDSTIADGNAGQGPAACCDPNLAWDTFGNLFLTYVDAATTSIVTILSTDGGATFSNLASFGPASVDQPTVVVANTTAPGVPVALWIVWNQGGQMVARGAAVTGLGVAGVGPFGALQTIPGTANCSFGDIAIAPSGVVVQACETPTGGLGPAKILVNTDADGLGPGNFGAAVAATTTNVGGWDFIPAQNVRGIDAEAGLAFDRNPASPHFGRLYLVYTEEVVFQSHDTDIMLRFSDDNGATWSAPIRVNDDPAIPIRSQFLPRIATNPLSGNIAVCWHDARNSATNTAMQEFCTIATRLDPTPVFMANVQISDGASTSNGLGVEFGDYSGLAYFQGLAHPVWADISNSTGDNPNLTANFDAYTDRVTGGAAAMEGDPHVTTVSGIHYDFQGVGDFVSLRDADGMEIQTRQTPVATTFTPGPDPYDGIAVNVSVNTAVAARVGGHRVTYQPNISGVPDPSGLQLRIDGAVTTLGVMGRDLGDGGRVVPSATGGGIEIDFPNGSLLIVTPGWWGSQSTWYLNVDAYHTAATEGIMGAIAPGSWLPALPNGASMGPMPATVQQRYTDLYQTFADAWRVSKDSSLFDYGPPAWVVTCDLAKWPQERPACVPAERPPAKPANARRARALCRGIVAKYRAADCIFDVTATGAPVFAKTYLLSQRIQLGATTTIVSADKDSTKLGELVTFSVTVARKVSAGRGAPTGVARFTLDGKRVGAPVKLDRNGRAQWRTSRLKTGTHLVAATYAPAEGSALLPSTSPEKAHTVEGASGR
jgi:Big-like domain-containing protein